MRPKRRTESSGGELLWRFQTSSGIVGQPVTWQQDGTQYVTVTSGDRNNDNAVRKNPNIANVSAMTLAVRMRPVAVAWDRQRATGFDSGMLKIE